jgi:hypothetical protein
MYRTSKYVFDPEQQKIKWSAKLQICRGFRKKNELEILYNATVIKWRIEVTKRTQKVANPFENVQFG